MPQMTLKADSSQRLQQGPSLLTTPCQPVRLYLRPQPRPPRILTSRTAQSHVYYLMLWFAFGAVVTAIINQYRPRVGALMSGLCLGHVGGRRGSLLSLSGLGEMGVHVPICSLVLHTLVTTRRAWAPWDGCGRFLAGCVLSYPWTRLRWSPTSCTSSVATGTGPGLGCLLGSRLRGWSLLLLRGFPLPSCF